MVRFAKINPYEHFGNWGFAILNHEKKYFQTLSIFLSTQNYVILETTHNKIQKLKRLKLLFTLKYID